MDPYTLEKLASELPADLVVALRQQGLSKVASNLTGLPVDDEYAVYHKIGMDLYRRRIENASIRAGLNSLAYVGGR